MVTRKSRKIILGLGGFLLLSAFAGIFGIKAKADVTWISSSPTQQILLPSAARTTAQDVKISTPAGLRCGHIIINVTAYTAGSLTPTIQGFDAGANAYYSILVGSAISATGRTILKVCPGITVAANVSAADLLPLNWQLNLAVGTADSITYSVTTVLLP